MTFEEAMKRLEAMGSEQTRKTYLRHGMKAPLFGVSFANLEKLRKEIKRDTALARELWASGNTDARTLATMIADPKTIDEATIDAWAGDLDHHTIADLFATNLVSKTPYAKKKAGDWTASREEWLARAGWSLVAALATKEPSVEGAFFGDFVPAIEREIGAARDRVREAMNSALIAFGGRGGELAGLALPAAKRIGRVEIDHGDTGCKTPDAVEYIEKLQARRAASKKR